MKGFLAMFGQSYRELKSVRTLTVVSLMVALNIVLGTFTLEFGPSLKLGFGYITTTSVGMLFGPVVGGIFGAVVDIVKYIIKPTEAYFFGFTLDAILAGLIFGSIFYRKKPSITRCIVAKASVNVFINLFLNTYWLSILMGKSVWVLLGPRVLKNILVLPFEVVIIFFTLKAVYRIFYESKLWVR